MWVPERSVKDMLKKGHRPEKPVGTDPRTRFQVSPMQWRAGTLLCFNIAGIFKLSSGFVGYLSEVVAMYSAVTRPEHPLHGVCTSARRSLLAASL